MLKILMILTISLNDVQTPSQNEQFVLFKISKQKNLMSQ